MTAPDPDTLRAPVAEAIERGGRNPWYGADLVLDLLRPVVDALTAERDEALRRAESAERFGQRATVDRAEDEERAEKAEAEVAALREHHGPCICNTGPGTEGPDEFCPWHGRGYNDALEYMGRIITDLRETVDRVKALDLSCDQYDPPWLCTTAGPEVIAAEGLCTSCRVRAALDGAE